MYEATTDTTMDATIGSIAARAARYPRIAKRAQLRTIIRGSKHAPVTGDPGIRWLLLNTQRTNRLLMGTG
jgi:hypothetical protein